MPGDSDTLYNNDFFDYHAAGSLESARIILREAFQLFRPYSIIDIGCGVGSWLCAASELGIDDLLGIDGAYVPREKLLISPQKFCALELERLNLEQSAGRRFDLVICAEVAEHLSPERAPSFIDELCALGDAVLFSAAVPGQGGTGHLNERWPDYWNAHFVRNGFACFDSLRPRLWDESRVEFWYIQNILLFARRGSSAFEASISTGVATSCPRSLIHPRSGRPGAARTPEETDRIGGDDFVSQNGLRPARDLKSRVDAYPRVLIAILAKQKENELPLFLRCIEELDYPKSSIVLYVRTNNNTDRTEQILRDWIDRVGPSYAGVEFDVAPVEEPVETFGQHEWNQIRFRVLGNIRNVSLAKTSEHACDFYFVCDVDNFIRPCTMRELVALKLPIVAPLLRVTVPNGYYSNFFAEANPDGFYGDCNQYQWILQQQVRGVFEVPVVHCTYLIRGDVIQRLGYLDGSDRYEFIVFSDSARKAGIQQYIDNRQVYGYLTFAPESDAAKGIVGDQRGDQIAFVRREIERQHGQKLSIQEPSTYMPTISVLAPRRPSNDFANGFNEFSETIFYGLRHLGYDARIVSRLSEADGQIIVVAANTLSHEEAMQLPAGTVIYNAEPFPQVWQVFPRYANEVLRKYTVWDYNPGNAKRLSASLGKAVEYVPLGYVPELTRIENADLQDIDVLFYGTVNARRRTILDRLEATGLKVNILCGVFGTERNAWISRSKVVLNVHSNEPGVFEIVRVAFLLANAKAVVSECNPGDAGEAVDADLLPGIVAAKYDDLVEACVSLVADDDRRHAIEQAGFAAFQARRESDILKNALAALR